MAKTAKTVTELEEIILKELNARPKCKGVSMVTIRQAVDDHGNRSWKVSHVNYGTSLESDCRVPMTQIVERLRREFDAA